MKKFKYISVLIALLGLFTPTAWSALIVYDGFNYPLGSTTSDADAGLNDGNGLPFENTGGVPSGNGTGLRNNWATGTIVSGLTYAGLQTSGNAYLVTVSNDVGTSNNPSIYINMTTDPYLTLRVDSSPSGALGSTWTSLYFSFLFQVSSVPTNNNSDRALLQLIGVNGYFAIGLSPSSTNAEMFSISNSMGGSSFSTVSATANQTYFLVARLDSVPGNDIMNLWVNPTPGGSLGTSDATLMGLDLGGFLQFSPRFEGSGISMIIDEVRIGTTYADVAPVPEPRVCALFGVGLGIVGILRRKRRGAAV